MKVKDKRKIKQDINLEKIKNQLINAEKSKFLQRFSVLHFKKIKNITLIEIFQ